MSDSKRRISWPVLIVLVAFLGGAAFLVIRAHESDAGGDGGAATIGRIDGTNGRSAAPPGGWQRHEWRENASEGGSLRERAGRAARERSERAEGSERGAPPASIPPGPVRDDLYDPQTLAMRRSFRVMDDAGAGALPFAPTTHAATIVDHEGDLATSPTATCQVRVLPVQTARFNCLVRVVCDGHVLYPNPSQTAGYAPCDVEDGQPVRAIDDGHTAEDGDPLVRVDLRAGVVTVSDRGEGVRPFRATLRVGPRI